MTFCRFFFLWGMPKILWKYGVGLNSIMEKNCHRCRGIFYLEELQSKKRDCQKMHFWAETFHFLKRIQHQHQISVRIYKLHVYVWNMFEVGRKIFQKTFLMSHIVQVFYSQIGSSDWNHHYAIRTERRTKFTCRGKIFWLFAVQYSYGAICLDAKEM